jgi:tRNA-splicing endonuclease subunit Sen34
VLRKSCYWLTNVRPILFRNFSSTLTPDPLGFAVLVDDPQAHTSPSLQYLQKWNSERIVSVKQQISYLESKEVKEKEESAGRAMSENALRKRQERETKRAAAAAIGQQTPNDNSHITLLRSTKPDPRSSTPSITPSSSTPPYTITIPGSSDTFPWHTPNPHTYTTIMAAQTAGIWDYPSTAAERAKCVVFQDLWDKGYFMGGGIKFGGDFLVYPGISPFIVTK